MKAESQNNNKEQLLFKLINQKYTRRTNVNSELQRILKSQFGITGISTHSLRHSYGTRCVESGMAPVVVQRLMGHTDITVTLNTYTSVFDKFKEAELDKVNKYYLNENLISTSENLLLNNEKDLI
ncbi:MAG TPA: tyrosine-type recombinase/integrase [Candidatus Scatovivens faecipullorum]|nr:tyrosine-type recombinase/integrase [Candidatus Scatovivens faecipullorum]